MVADYAGCIQIFSDHAAIRNHKAQQHLRHFLLIQRYASYADYARVCNVSAEASRSDLSWVWFAKAQPAPHLGIQIGVDCTEILHRAVD